MIFRPELVEKILAGEKTITRRKVQYRFSESLLGGKARIKVKLPCRYKEGRAYAIQPGRGQGAVGRLRVVNVSTEELGGGLDWSTSEAEREGFDGWPEFAEYWTKLYGDYDPAQLVHRIEFELVGRAA